MLCLRKLSSYLAIIFQHTKLLTPNIKTFFSSWLLNVHKCLYRMYFDINNNCSLVFVIFTTYLPYTSQIKSVKKLKKTKKTKNKHANNNKKYKTKR